MSTVTLSAVKTGMTRLRTKGGASPSSLFELTNAYVTAAKTIVPRPGSDVYASIPAGTIGLALVNGVLQLFAENDPGGIPSGFSINLLNPPVDGASLVRIWLAAPLMGGLYVVAEWSDDPTRGIHYWLRGVGGPGSGKAWTADTVYMLGDFVLPSTPNGVAYTAQRLGEPYKRWGPGMEVVQGDIVEPEVFNGYYYVAEEVNGAARTGKKEPSWPAKDGATVVEAADAPAPAAPPSSTPPSGVDDRYSNPGGGSRSPGGRLSEY